MSGFPGRQRDVFDGPATYRICVQGRIGDRRASDYLPQMEVTVVPLEGGGFVTTLVGEVRDQTALVSLVSALHEWQLPMLSLQRLSTAPAAKRAPHPA